MSLGAYRDHCEFIVGAARVLLAHHYEPNHSEDIRDGVDHDWIAALEPFTADCITEARDRWVKGMTRKPTPADIRTLCFLIVAGR